MKRFAKRVNGYYRLKLSLQSLQGILKRRANFLTMSLTRHLVFLFLCLAYVLVFIYFGLFCSRFMVVTQTE